MKLIIFLTLSIFAFSEAGINSVEYKHKKNGGTDYTLEWNSFTLNCPKKGTDCKKIVSNGLTKDVSANITSVHSGYLLVSNVPDFDFVVNGIIENTVSPNGYSFYEDEYDLTIESCPDFPHLEGLIFDLEGLTVDANGQITIFIPSGTY